MLPTRFTTPFYIVTFTVPVSLHLRSRLLRFYNLRLRSFVYGYLCNFTICVLRYLHTTAHLTTTARFYLTIPRLHFVTFTTFLVYTGYVTLHVLRSLPLIRVITFDLRFTRFTLILRTPRSYVYVVMHSHVATPFSLFAFAPTSLRTTYLHRTPLLRYRSAIFVLVRSRYTLHACTLFDSFVDWFVLVVTRYY